MAHVGKYVPWLLKNQVVEGNSPSTALLRPPSRKIKARFNALGNAGSAAIQWNGLEVVSSVGDYWLDDSTWTIYVFTNPTNTNLTISVRYKYRQNVPVSGSVTGRFDCVCRHEVSGSFIAEDTREFLYDEPWNRSTYRVQIGPNWIDDPNPSLQSALGFQMRAANWAEQPEYHPYRH